MRLQRIMPASIGYDSCVDVGFFNRYAETFTRTARIGWGKRFFCSMLLGVVMSTTASFSAAAGHIEIVREIHPEGGMSEPGTLAQTKEGGYVVAGVDHGVAVAMRIDADGKVQWRHNVDHRQLGARVSSYQGVAVLPDDSTVLCGFVEKVQPFGVDGILTHVDRGGKILSQRTMRPNFGDEPAKVSYLDGCLTWGEGVLLIGHALRISVNDPAHPRNEMFAWLMALDVKAEIKWEKLLPGLGGATVEVLRMPNQDLVAQLGGGPIFRVGSDGALKSKNLVPGWMIRQWQGRPVVAVLFPPDEHSVTLRTLGEQLDVVKTVTGTAAPISPKAATYALADGSLAVFGFQRGGVTKAAVSWIGADMNNHEKLVFDSYGDSIWVSDAVPTGNSGEFAAIRPVIKERSGSFDLGMVLSFVRFK